MSHFFISYRRSDQEGQYLAHMIFRELRRRYGEENVFLDVDSRSPGLSFPVKVDRALSVTDVVLVIIGPAWLQVLTERLEDSRDWVRYEIAESLKRRLLPVVPVCRAGVEMPRLHQLPEELKDLAWRDGVILDPFQDFDRHLARLLSDLERVLAASSREKEELRLARWKLIDLLRWRAQMNLAAIQKAAATKLAEERAIQERALAENRAAKWAAALEASELAVQEAKTAAAERAAAKSKETPKKSEPNLPRAREATVSKSNLTSFPKARSGSVATPSIAPKEGTPATLTPRPVSSLPSTREAVKLAAPARYYLGPSKRLMRALLGLVVSGPMIFALAFGYSYSLLNLSFLPADFILTLLYGLLTGMAAGFSLRWCKALNEEVAALIGLVAGLGAVYLSWAAWLFGHGIVPFLYIASSPASLWRHLGNLSEVGLWSIWGYRPTGAVLWSLWSLEAALIVGLSILFTFVVVIIKESILCEKCNTWCHWHRGVAKLRSSEPADLKRRIQAKDLAFLAALGGSPPGADKWLQLNLERCGNCGMTNTLEAFEVSLVTDTEGRQTPQNEWFVSGLLMTAAECDEIERIGREAARSAQPL